MMENSLKNKVFSGLFWKFGESILAQGVSFIVSVVLARLLSPDDYGIIAMVLVFINLANVFVTSGFATSLIQKKSADETDFSTMFYCSLCCSILVYGILFLCAPYIASFYKNDFLCIVIRVFGLRIPISVYSSIQHAYVSKNMLFKRFFFSTLFGTISSGVIGIVMAYAGLGVWALVAQYFTNTVVDTFILARTVPWYPKLRFSKSSAKELMGYGARILIADLSGTFFSQLRNLIIGRVYTSADLAFYNKGQQMPALITTNLSTSVMSVLFPAISTESDNLIQVKKITQRAIKILAFIMFPMLFGLAAVAEPLVVLIYTSKWISCVPYVQILCIDAAIGLITTASLQAIKAIGRGDVMVKLEFLKKPVYIFLLVIGVKINVLAIAVTMVIYEIYGAIVNMKQLKRYVYYSIGEQLKDLIPALLISIAMMIGVSFINLDNMLICLVLRCAGGIFFYITVAYLLKLESIFYLKNIVRNYIKKDKKRWGLGKL